MFEKKNFAICVYCRPQRTNDVYKDSLQYICKYTQKIMINNKYNCQRLLRNVSLKQQSLGHVNTQVKLFFPRYKFCQISKSQQ